MLSFITRGDNRVMQSANNWPAPRWVRLWATAATRAGDGWIWYATGLAILLWGDTDRFAGAGACASAAAASVLSFMILKRVTGRARPHTIEPHCWSKLLPPDRFSFPSGHTMTAFAVSTTASLFFPSVIPVLAFAALSIAASRILLGMHFLSDVLAGAVLGSVIGWAAWFSFS